MQTLFDVAPLTGYGWASRKDDPDHATTEGGVCADERCAVFEHTYKAAFTRVRDAAIVAGYATFHADKVRDVAQRMTPGCHPHSTYLIGGWWKGWVKDGLIESVGAAKSAAKGANGTLNHLYRPLPTAAQIEIFEALTPGVPHP